MHTADLQKQYLPRAAQDTHGNNRPHVDSFAHLRSNRIVPQIRVVVSSESSVVSYINTLPDDYESRNATASNISTTPFQTSRYTQNPVTTNNANRIYPGSTFQSPQSGGLTRDGATPQGIRVIRDVTTTQSVQFGAPSSRSNSNTIDPSAYVSGGSSVDAPASSLNLSTITDNKDVYVSKLQETKEDVEKYGNGKYANRGTIDIHFELERATDLVKLGRLRILPWMTDRDGQTNPELDDCKILSRLLTLAFTNDQVALYSTDDYNGEYGDGNDDYEDEDSYYNDRHPQESEFANVTPSAFAQQHKSKDTSISNNVTSLSPIKDTKVSRSLHDVTDTASSTVDIKKTSDSSNATNSTDSSGSVTNSIDDKDVDTKDVDKVVSSKDVDDDPVDNTSDNEVAHNHDI